MLQKIVIFQASKVEWIWVSLGILQGAVCMADGFVRRLKKADKNLLVVVFLFLVLFFQRVDPTPCPEKELQNIGPGGLRVILKHPPCRRLSASQEFFVPKHNKGSRRTRYGASDHEVPSGPNPISNR